MARSGRAYPNHVILIRGSDSTQDISCTGIPSEEAFGTTVFGLFILPSSFPRIVAETLKTSDNRTATEVLTLGSDSAVGDTLVISYSTDFFDVASMPDVTSTAGTPVLVNTADLGTNIGHIKVYTLAVDTPGAQTVTIPAHSGCDIHGIVMRLSGTSTVDTSATNVWNGISTSSSHVAPSLTVANSGEFLVCVWMQNGGGSWSGPQYVVPGSMVRQQETDSSPFSASAMGTELLSSSGATGTRTATWPPATAKWGAVSVALILPPSEDFGTPSLAVAIDPPSIPSEEAFGNAQVSNTQPIVLTGISSLETFGSASLQLGYPQTITLTGISSLEVFGYITIQNTKIWVLLPDHIQETPAGRNILHLRYGIDRGISLVKVSGIWSEVRYPAQTELEEAQKFYLGGRKYYLTNEEASDLISQGFGSLLHLEPLPSYQGVSG